MHVPSWTHWVFDGFGVAIPVAIVAWVAQRRRRMPSGETDQTIKSGKNSVNVQSQGDVHVRDIGKP